MGLDALLRKFGIDTLCIHSKRLQPKRVQALAKFKNGEARILLATDVASRGIDIPFVDLVINFDLPISPRDYVHRVGRSARSGLSGRCLSFVTQYDIELLNKIETFIDKKLELYALQKASVL